LAKIEVGGGDQGITFTLSKFKTLKQQFYEKNNCTYRLGIGHDRYQKLWANQLQAALQKGSWMIGGSLGLTFGSMVSESQSQFSNSKIELSYTTLTNSPKGIFFVTNGIGVGLGVDVNYFKLKNKDGNSESSQTQYLLGPVFRYYAPYGLFFHADVAFGKSTSKSSGGISETQDSNQIKWQLGVGYAAFVNDFISVEPSIMYRKSSDKEKHQSTESTLKTGDFIIGVGLNIFLHKIIVTSFTFEILLK
jgi:hypothetical protein